MGRYRMVTLEGDLVEKSGAMTGGHYRSKMRFAAEEKSRLMELSENIAEAEAERSSRLDKQDQIEEQISKLAREVEEMNREISKKTFQMDEMGSSRPRLENAIKENLGMNRDDHVQQHRQIAEVIDGYKSVNRTIWSNIIKAVAVIGLAGWVGTSAKDLPIMISKPSDRPAQYQQLETPK